MKLLVDADIVAYKFSFLNEFSIDWGNGVSSEVYNEERAKAGVVEYVDMLMDKTGANGMFMAMSHLEKKSFRYKLYKPYKANRTQPKPKLLPVLQRFILDKYPSRTLPHLEGDDILGLLSTATPGEFIIVSNDKDLRQIPGLHWDFDTEETFEVSLWDGDIWFYTQVLTGDAVDNYPGCPGVGKVKARKVFEDVIEDNYQTIQEADLWDAVVEVYTSRGFRERDALTQAQVARILRDGEYKDGKPIIWTPPKRC